uniref:Solute carrier family 35 member F2 n=1 Tax=Gasterosteus aculeatus aculeatus TaxID=481459 RepID=A0AAQ4PLB7_GASAC
MEVHGEERLCGKWKFACGLYSYNLRDVFTWRLLKTIFMGQVLSLLICGTAVSCQYLVTAGVETPMLQSFFNYALLLLVYTTTLCTRKGERNILQVLKTKWWKYLLMGVADVEANYAVVKAYQFTTLTSIQLLDCFVIPVLMVLSWFLLKTRYRLVHFVAVAVCLLGVGAMVGADIVAERHQGSTSDVVLGDGLVLLSAVLYAVSNVGQEYTVKNLSRVEFLGMMGLFGTLISGIQLAALETRAVAAIKWDLCICKFDVLAPLNASALERARWRLANVRPVVSCSRAVCGLRSVHVRAVQLHARGGEDDQRHGGQPLPAHRRPLQPLLWPLLLPLRVFHAVHRLVSRHHRGFRHVQRRSHLLRSAGVRLRRGRRRRRPDGRELLGPPNVRRRRHSGRRDAAGCAVTSVQGVVYRLDKRRQCTSTRFHISRHFTSF